ncbi:MAG: hypothetical protein QHH09_00650 [Microgenomates group bacterium]|nr:hypothetical protein [Microgenomates group bacterium]
MTKKKKQKKSYLSFVFVLVLAFFVFFNVYFSQKIPSVYLQLIDEKKPAVVVFLKSITSLPIFDQEFLKYRNLFGQKLEEEVFSEKKSRQQLIKKLEQILEKNPNARDVFSSLSFLYQLEDNQTKADQYWQQAKNIDPLLTPK